MATDPCTPGACGSCPLSGLCGEPLVDDQAPDRDPAEPRPEGAGCCGGSCSS